MLSNKQIKTARIGYIIMSSLLILCGIILISFPENSLNAICKIIGGIMLVYGIVKIIGYFSYDLYGLAFQFDLAYGLLLLVVGAIMLIFTDKISGFLGFLLGLIVLADALFKIQITIDSKKFGLSKWWLIALLALLTAAVGIWLIADTAAFAQLTMILSGLLLLCEGVLNICVVIFAVKINKNQKQNKK